jgi:cupin 2 domain-containing protein
MNDGNLFEGIAGEMPEELTEVLASGEGKVRVERIVSRGHASAEGFWYEQEDEEFVVLLKGSGVLRFEEGDVIKELKAGDWVLIPAGCRHRVERTAEGGEETVWLAVYFEEAV